MTVDARLLVSDAQALTATAVATDTIPLGLAGLPVSTGEPIGFQFNIDVAADFTTGDETYEFQIVTSTASDGTTGQDVISSEAVVATTLVAGYSFILPVPVGRIAATATHITAKYVLAGTTPTATVTAFLTPLSAANERNANIRSGFSVAS